MKSLLDKLEAKIKTNDDLRKAILYIVLTKNPKYPLTPNEAKGVIKAIEEVKSGDIKTGARTFLKAFDYKDYLGINAIDD